MRARREQRRAAYKERVCNTDRRWYLLSGLLRCSTCGKCYTIRTDKRGKSRYGCPTRKNDRNGCGNRRTISQPDVERRVKYLVEVLAKNPTKLAELVRQRESEWQRVHEHDRARVAQLEEQLSKALKAVENWEKAIEACDDPAEIAGFVQRQRERKAEAARLGAELDDARARVSGLEDNVEVLLNLDRFVHGDGRIFMDDLDKDREVVHRVITQIDVHPTGEIVVWFLGGLLEAVGGYWITDEKVKPGTLASDRQALVSRMQGLDSGVYMLKGLGPEEMFLADVPPPGGYQRDSEDADPYAPPRDEDGAERTSPRGIFQ